MAYEKHVGVYKNQAELKADLSNLKSPWVAYVETATGGFEVHYSTDMVWSGDGLTIEEEVLERIDKLENSVVTLTEDEYENLIKAPQGEKIFIHPLGGEPVEISYSPDVFYYTYDPDDLPNED